MTEVLPINAPLRASASHTSFFDASAQFGHPRRNSYSFTDLRSPSLLSSRASSSIRSTPASSLSLDTRLDDDDDIGSTDDDAFGSDDDHDGLSFSMPRSIVKPQHRCLDDDDEHEAPPSSPVLTTHVPPSSDDTPLTTPDALPISEDDTAVRSGPSRHVDYLTYDWKEEDIWASWRHIVEHRSVYGERSRLENASWRTWAKRQFSLKTTSPESLNWLKDVDVTWLYGPLQPAANRLNSQQTSEPPSRLSKTNSFLHKKPILKKRSMSEVMLQNSISTSSLVKQAASQVQAQQATGLSLERRRQRPAFARAATDFPVFTSRTISRDPADYFSSHSTSGLQTPDFERKHIRFDDKVEQCIAVEVKGADEDDEDDYNHNPWARARGDGARGDDDDDSSSDDGVVMMKHARKKRPLSRVSSKTNVAADTMIIAKLPSTTLKYRTDSPDPAEQAMSHSLGFYRSSSRLSPSPSQETLRPSDPANNFLLDDPQDSSSDDFTFGASDGYDFKRSRKRSSTDLLAKRGTCSASSSSSSPSDPAGAAGGLRRTASGMFMPVDEGDAVDDDGTRQPPGIIGRVVDTVNTARDIAHVIWNVGWRN